MSIIGILIWLLVALVVALCLKYALDAFEVTGPIRQLILLIAALLMVLILLNQLGVAGAPLRVW